MTYIFQFTYFSLWFLFGELTICARLYVRLEQLQGVLWNVHKIFKSSQSLRTFHEQLVDLKVQISLQQADIQMQFGSRRNTLDVLWELIRVCCASSETVGDMEFVFHFLLFLVVANYCPQASKCRIMCACLAQHCLCLSSATLCPFCLVLPCRHQILSVCITLYISNKIFMQKVNILQRPLISF
jgi:hypothetical protein